MNPHWSYPFMLATVLTTLMWSIVACWKSSEPCQHYAVARTVYCTAYNASGGCIAFERTAHEKMTCVDDSWSWYSYEGDK